MEAATDGGEDGVLGHLSVLLGWADDRPGEMNFPQTPILLFLWIGTGWRGAPAGQTRSWLAGRYRKMISGAGWRLVPIRQAQRWLRSKYQ